MLQLPQNEESYWRDSTAIPVYPKLTTDVEVDAVIVGGGIAGLTCAYLLKQTGKKVAVLERGTIGRGTSGHTTGKVTSQHGLIYTNLVEQLGRKTARIYGQANQEAIEQIERLIKQEKIDCRWQRNDNYVYTRQRKRVKIYRKEAAVAATLGLPASFEDQTSLPFEVRGAVRFANQAQFDSMKYMVGLAGKIEGQGSYIFQNTRALMVQDGQPAKVRIKNATVIAKDVIIATNVPTPPLAARVGYCLLEYPQTSYIVAARTKKNIQGMYISTDKNEYSILPIRYGKDNLILVGGQGHIRDFKLNKRTRWQRLADYAEERLGATSIEYKWSAWDYQAYDDIPLVGRLYPWSKHLYIISAFRKWGLSSSMVAAMILRDVILGQKNEWAKIYDPMRMSPIKSIPKVAAGYIWKR